MPRLRRRRFLKSRAENLIEHERRNTGYFPQSALHGIEFIAVADGYLGWQLPTQRSGSSATTSTRFSPSASNWRTRAGTAQFAVMRLSTCHCDGVVEALCRSRSPLLLQRRGSRAVPNGSSSTVTMLTKMCFSSVNGAIPVHAHPPAHLGEGRRRALWQAVSPSYGNRFRGGSAASSGTRVEMLCGQPAQKQGSAPASATAVGGAPSLLIEPVAARAKLDVVHVQARPGAHAPIIMGRSLAHAASGAPSIPDLPMTRGRRSQGSSNSSALTWSSIMPRFSSTTRTVSSSIDELVESVGFKRPYEPDLVEAQAERLGLSAIDAEHRERVLQIEPCLSGGCNADPRRACGRRDPIDAVGASETP